MKAPIDHFSNISYLMVETNSTCNLKCAFCSRTALDEAGLRPTKILTEDEFKAVLDPFKDCPIDAMKIQGLSEPFMHPHFDKMAAMARGYFPKAHIIVISNMMYKLEKTKMLQTLPYISELFFSIDGTGEVLEAARAGSSWKKALETLADVKRLFPDDFRKNKTFLNFTLTEHNYKELPKIYALQKEYDLAGVRFNLAQNWFEDEVNQHTYSDEITDFIWPYREDLKGVGGWEYKDCFWPFEGAIIDCYGDVRQCLVNTTMKPIGNVFKEDIREIYNNSKVFIEAREMLSRNCPPDQCKTCDYAHLSGLLAKLQSGLTNTVKARNVKVNQEN